jgi:hypothetical protein
LGKNGTHHAEDARGAGILDRGLVLSPDRHGTHRRPMPEADPAIGRGSFRRRGAADPARRTRGAVGEAAREGGGGGDGTEGKRRRGEEESRRRRVEAGAFRLFFFFSFFISF